MAQKRNWREKTKTEEEEEGRERTARQEEKERRACLSLPSLWYDKFMHSSCVCQSRPGVFVGQFLRERKEGREEGEKEGGRERERAETLSSNSRKWVDPDRGRLCSLCGFNESTVFRTQRGTGELA